MELDSGGVPTIGTTEAAKRRAIAAILRELERAETLASPIVSAHEAHSIIREEFEEFWDEVRAAKNPQGRDRPNMPVELVQVGAMVVRALIDLRFMDEPEG